MAMQQQLLVSSMLLLFLWPLNPWPLVRAQSMARPGCSDRCGDVIIPYPFGKTRGCYLHDVFRIDCQDNPTTPRLSLGNNSTELEVIRISVENGTIEVMFPIVHDCGGDDKSGFAIDFRGSPFAFSSTFNIFAATGCNNLALLNETNSTVAGCMSMCNKKSPSNRTPTSIGGGCSGINCCQTTIPSAVQAFKVYMSDYPESNSGKQCHYAFLVDQSWFSSNMVRSLDSARVMNYVPVVLEWEVDYKSYAPILSNRSLEFDYSYSTLCTTSNSTVNKGSIVRCKCFMGYEGNAYIPYGCTGDRNHKTRKDRNSNEVILLGVGLGVGVPLLAIVIWQLYRVLRKHRNKKLREKFFKRNGGLLLQERLLSGEVNVDTVKMFTSKELDKATDHYNVNRMLGQGGQGTVYKGMLADGRIVAVKKSKALHEGKTRQFINEVVILSQINHRNVVKVLGCCLETEDPLLVYEFIPNGNLFDFLREKNEEIPSTWNMRLRIAAEVAGALSYLHSSASIPIYHRDIKSTNILLDEKYKAKVADFGTSKSVTIDQTHVTTIVQGTFGYLDPEYFRSSQFTDKSDVYSFGVVLVELLTGEQPISFTRSVEARSMVEYFIRAMEENRLFDIVDAQIVAQGKTEEIKVVAKLAKRCLSWTGKERPTMKEIAMVLEGIPKFEKVLNNAPIHVYRQEIMERY